MAEGETAKAHTVGGEKRRAFAAQEDMYIDTAWGEAQFIAKGGLVTFMGDEAIGNNNPCDMVLFQEDKEGVRVLTEAAKFIERDAENQGIEVNKGLQTFFEVAGEEDKKNKWLNQRREVKEALRFNK
ncbi:MAG: hypothetical protein FWF23_05065 [Alphaproteobacteria bacterium]|nr:hypothetical protein [Alphaproteobacteria bacterium]MCL2504739.1 hypothetical protein [Alphaproteobacteria bacterium]